MTDSPFLLAIIAHGKPVFEIGYKTCDGEHPCQPECGMFHICQEEGPSWVTNTGMVARPYWSKSLAELGIEPAPDGCWCWGWNKEGSCEGLIPIPDDSWPDHFQSSIDRQPRATSPSFLLASLGLAKAKVPLTRRPIK